MKRKMMRKVLFILCLTGLLPILVNAQFSSGSTGADGVLDLSTMSCTICRIQLPESGVLNYTTVNVPAGRTLRFINNSRNTPAYVLAQANITINGSINVSSIPNYTCGSSTFQELGPGGFRGGQVNRPGFGPGGGQNNNDNGKWVGPLSLVPMIGGSGGAGTVQAFFQSVGGDGGGAIAIASSTSIIGSGSIEAKGSLHGNCSYLSTSGSGGAIRLVANTINFSGSFNACSGNCGVVRLEATSSSFTGNSSPPAVLAPINPNIVSDDQPRLTIVTIGGYSVPSYAGTRFDTVDLLLPNQIPDPVNVVVSANNIPVGIQVEVGFVSGSPGGTSAPCNLAGTFSSSSCTATISNLNRTGVTYLLATAAFTPPSSLAQFNPKGENFVDKVRLEAVLGAKPKYIFLNSQGKVIDNPKISKNFLQFFGM